jgi:hypothetical protein
MGHVPTSADKRAGGPANQTVRVVPGRYASYLAKLETGPGEGVTGWVMSRRSEA